ncbi:hypothetical protein KC19_VG083800 [Ceratodon purpureus]|uniref:Uncharacterized protein n=1 Tax=Ceratodon purpureus TaxID=3225 RepID=A0A8T0HND7_CERPU|nr:hypothetical protein KC19_VG083800 [Ceratodon purpureus]
MIHSHMWFTVEILASSTVPSCSSFGLGKQGSSEEQLLLLRKEMASWQCAIRDGVLSQLLRQVTTPPDSWDSAYMSLPGPLPRQQGTIQDVENARHVCSH